MIPKAQGRIKPRALNIASFNAYGLTKNLLGLISFVNDHAIDVLLVQETLCSQRTRSRLAIPNFSIIRNDRDARGGGTAIYYRRSLHCIAIPSPTLENLEVSVCRMGMTGHASITIVSAYLRPNKRLLRTDLDAVFALGDSVILAGDLNCKHPDWHSTRANTNGRRLLEMSSPENLNLNILGPSAPTHYHYNGTGDVLDIAVLKDITLSINSLEVIYELDSDHRPVILKLGPCEERVDNKLITDWDRVATALECPIDNLPTDIHSRTEAEAAISCLVSHIDSAISNSTREVSVSSSRRKLPDDIRELMRQRNAAIRAHDARPTEANRSIMRSLHRQVRESVREWKNDDWATVLSEIRPSHVSYWRVAKALKTEPPKAIPPFPRPNMPPAFEDGEKAECLADTLEQQCSLSQFPADPVHAFHVESEICIRGLQPLTDELPPVSDDEVRLHINKLKTRSSPGHDGINNRALKALPPALITLLAAIFNTLITHCHFPSSWKEAVVIGIPKPGKPLSDPSSFRPISLLPCLGKLYERILASRLKDYLFTNNLLINEQFGFRPHHSCVHQVHRIVEYATEGHAGLRHKPTAALFLDVAKAFDRVWHSGLIYKLYKLNVPDRLVRIIQDYLTDRTFRYRFEKSLSSPRRITAGVPQGSVLAPTLFNIYTNDIPRDKIPAQLALFADDTALYHKGTSVEKTISVLQKSINVLCKWFSKWRIEINASKSNAILFSRPKSRKPFRFNLTRLRINNVSLPWKDVVTYLGVTLDKNLTFKKHIKKVRNRAKLFLGKLNGMIGRRSVMSLRNKVTLYKTCIRPVLSYASPVFAHSSVRSLHSLQVVQNLFTRRATDAPYYVRNVDLHRDLQLPPIEKLFKARSKSFFVRAKDHSNPLIREAASYTPWRLARVRQPICVLNDPDSEFTVKVDKQMDLLKAYPLSSASTSRTHTTASISTASLTALPGPSASPRNSPTTHLTRRTRVHFAPRARRSRSPNTETTARAVVS